MAKRRKIGIAFANVHSGWIGGIYYITNLISALKTLSEEEKPHIFIIYSHKKTLKYVKDLNYPYVDYLPLGFNFFEKVINKIAKIVFNKQLIKKKYKQNFDAVFPFIDEELTPFVRKKLFWIPDFQEHYLPHFFKAEEIKMRNESHNKLVLKHDAQIIFSSKNAESDFKKFYSQSNQQTFVLNFATTLPPFTHINKEILLKKYNIEVPYFICPNQFWAHKNHIIILKALAKLKAENANVLVIFTGKEDDYRNPDYFSDLKKYVQENNLENNVKFLGFIDRAEQLSLVESSISIIQPSLFEGWSTVVEDGKALNQFIILSDIYVHREQLKSNVEFFDPYNEDSLIIAMRKVITGQTQKITFDYFADIRAYGENFIKIIDK